MSGRLSSDPGRPHPRGWKTLHQGTGAIIGVSAEKRTRNKGTADPIIVKHATSDLDEDVSSGRLERGVDVGSALGARLGEKQSFLLCPSFPLLGRDLSSLEREVALVAHENACQVRVCVRAYIGEPGPCVFKTYSSGELSALVF